jgi:hypothetical protein
VVRRRLVVAGLGACALLVGVIGAGQVLAASPSPAISPEVPPQDVMKREHFSPLEPGRYFIDPDGDPATPLRVAYDIPSEGWSAWIGAAKFSDVGHVGVSITTVANLVTDGCQDHAWADPAIGPSVDDLVVALTSLHPFEIIAQPTDVTVVGYPGKHLEWVVPDVPITGAVPEALFTGCELGQLKSWVGFIDADEPRDAFYGYTGPGYREEFWILDIDGVRLMIAAERSPGTPSADLDELERIVASISIEP